MKRITVLSEDDAKDKKAGNETEQEILNIKTQIENKKNAMPDEPKAKLNAQKAIKDLEARILTLKQSLPEKKSESGMKQLKVKADLKDVDNLFDSLIPKKAGAPFVLPKEVSPAKRKVLQRYVDTLNANTSLLKKTTDPTKREQLKEAINEAHTGLRKMGYPL